MKRSPADNLDAIKMLRENADRARREVIDDAKHRFARGCSVWFCAGPGCAVVVCDSLEELEAAMRMRPSQSN